MADHRICKIEECDKQAGRGRGGMCHMHYMRWYKHGDPSITLVEKGGHWRWLVETAFTFNEDRCLEWPFERNWKGYGRVHHKGRRVAVHRAVCIEVHGRAPSKRHVVAHSCGNGHLGCVNPRHLRWATQKENHADKFIHGTIARGSRNGNAKMDEQTARMVKAMIPKMTQREIAARLGITRSAVRDLKIGKTWGWLT